MAIRGFGNSYNNWNNGKVKINNTVKANNTELSNDNALKTGGNVGSNSANTGAIKLTSGQWQKTLGINVKQGGQPSISPSSVVGGFPDHGSAADYVRNHPGDMATYYEKGVKMCARMVYNPVTGGSYVESTKYDDSWGRQFS